MTEKSQLARLGLFDAKVPRYTSYPTAPHFSGDVTPDDFAGWIEAIPTGTAISLYVHVPFCRRLCWFCACRTQGISTDAPLEGYVNSLLAELALTKARLPDGVTLSSLHLGGGTPTLLPAPLLDKLLGAIRDTVPMGEGAEISVEIDPNEIDSARLDALVRAGMNRASIGVQDFDPDIQKIIGREQSYEVTHDAAAMIRDAGISGLNMDILFGLPNQTRARLSASVQKLLSLSPDRVALYGYAHVPWMAKRQQLIPSDALPTPEKRLKLYETARQLFMWDGYNEIGIDHFATESDGLTQALLAGKLRRNFQGYTDDQADYLIGVGASSISRFPQGYAQNAPATGAHVGAIQDGRFSTTRGHRFVGEDVMRARIIEMIMCDFAVDAAEITDRFDISPADLSDLLSRVNAQFENGLDLSERGLFIPESARPLTRMIARAVDAYDLSHTGHSPAI